MEWLDNWENGSKNDKNTFFTQSTAQGLRVTLQSTVELAKYLLEHCKFKYVLTGKLNQDCLEVLVVSSCLSSSVPTQLFFRISSESPVKFVDRTITQRLQHSCKFTACYPPTASFDHQKLVTAQLCRQQSSDQV